MKPDSLFPVALCAALLGSATLVSAWQSPRGPVERSDFAQLAAGDHHTVALASDGTVWAWGDNAEGQLGDGTTAPHSAPAPVPGLDAIEQVHAHGSRSIALRRDGTVWVWGRSSGDDGESQATPQQVSTLEPMGRAALSAP